MDKFPWVPLSAFVTGLVQDIMVMYSPCMEIFQNWETNSEENLFVDLPQYSQGNIHLNKRCFEH